MTMFRATHLGPPELFSIPQLDLPHHSPCLA